MSSVVKLQDKTAKTLRSLLDEIIIIDNEEVDPIDGTQTQPLKTMLLSKLGLLPFGGTTGQVLKKTSDDDLDIEWGDGERLKTNTIIVNENAVRNIGGKLYSNLSAAITWINSITPAPSVTNTWNIVVEGDYNPDTEESIIIPVGVVISGSGGNTIGANVTVDSPALSVTSSLMDKIVATGFNSIIFKGKLNITYKGLDPLTGSTQPYVTGLSIRNVVFSPDSISGTGVGTMVFVTTHSNVFRGDYTDFYAWCALYTNIIPLDGHIYIGSFHFINCNIMSMAEMNPDYGLSFVNEGFDDRSHFASNCYCNLTKPANSYVFDGFGEFITCTLQIAWDGIKSRGLSFSNCHILGQQIIGNPGVDDNTLQVYSDDGIFFHGGTLNVYNGGIIELLADDGEQSQVTLEGTQCLNSIEIKKTMSGTTGTAIIFLENILNLSLITIDGSVDNVIRTNCLWDDAPDTDENNFYSAKKIHELIV